MDEKISALSADTTPATGDLLPIVSVGVGSTMKITLSTIITFIAAAVKTLTNTLFDTAGTGNTFKINGTAISAVTGTGSAVLATQPTLIAPLPTAIASSGSSGTTTFNMATGNFQNFTFSGSSASDSVTFALSNVTSGQVFVVSVTQNSGGSGTVTWFSTIRWVNGTTPTLTTTASKRDTFGFIATSTSTFDGFTIGQNI